MADEDEEITTPVFTTLRAHLDAHLKSKAVSIDDCYTVLDRLVTDANLDSDVAVYPAHALVQLEEQCMRLFNELDTERAESDS
jgi:hypothetical protein